MVANVFSVVADLAAAVFGEAVTVTPVGGSARAARAIHRPRGRDELGLVRDQAELDFQAAPAAEAVAFGSSAHAVLDAELQAFLVGDGARVVLDATGEAFLLRAGEADGHGAVKFQLEATQ